MQVPLAMARRAVSLVSSLADLEDPDRFAELALPGIDRVVGSDVLHHNEVGPAWARCMTPTTRREDWPWAT